MNSVVFGYESLAINFILILVFGDWNGLAEVNTGVVEELELLSLVVVPGLLLLPPVHIRGLGGQSDAIGYHEDHSAAHDDEERLQSHVVFQRCPSHSLEKSYVH